MTKNKDVKTCKDCVKRIFCWERSREYPCRNFDDMYSKGHEHEENKNKHRSTHTSVGTGFGASDSGNSKGCHLLKNERNGQIMISTIAVCAMCAALYIALQVYCRRTGVFYKPEKVQKVHKNRKPRTGASR